MAGSFRALTLADFAGSWTISRRIDDLKAGKVAMLDGEARFTPVAAGLEYRETGLLKLEDQPPLHAERRYVWKMVAKRIEVRFDDGRHFHVFDPSGPRAAAHHRCDPDDYRVIYTFLRWPEWKAEWRVEGPNKRYRMATEYRRA